MTLRDRLWWFWFDHQDTVLYAVIPTGVAIALGLYFGHQIGAALNYALHACATR